MTDFYVADHIEVSAAGEPGRRTFHLRILGQSGQSASLKLEKEHLVGLLTGVTGLLAEQGGAGEPEASGGVASFPQTADQEFPVGSVGMGFDKDSKMVVLQLEELQTDDGQDLSAIQVRCTLAQSVSLVQQLKEIIGAGRPACPLCGAPLDSAGHVCVRSNGHSQQPIPGPPDAEQP
jgi:uncharacterized repeat protein (TIGR03847 family)